MRGLGARGAEDGVGAPSLITRRQAGVTHVFDDELCGDLLQQEVSAPVRVRGAQVPAFDDDRGPATGVVGRQRAAGRRRAAELVAIAWDTGVERDADVWRKVLDGVHGAAALVPCGTRTRTRVAAAITAAMTIIITPSTQ